MATFLISYDLKDASTADYTKVKETIEKLGDAQKCLETTWLLASNKSAEDIARELKKIIGDKDMLLVITISQPLACTPLLKGTYKWIAKNLPAEEK